MKFFHGVKIPWLYIVIIFFLTFVFALLLLIASSNPDPYSYHIPGNPVSENNSYYNLLSDAFLQGQISLLIEPQKNLLILPDPYDPILNKPYRLHDASLFNGKYYLYWGPVPAVVSYIPFRFLSMGNLPDTIAALIYVFGGIIFNILLLIFIKNRYFKNLSITVFFTSITAISLCTIIPFLLSRIAVYEVAITGGYFFISCAMFFLFTGALYPGKSQNLKLVLGSLLLGFAVGSRYTLFFVAILLPTAWFLIVKEWDMSLKERLIQSWKTIASLLVPFLTCIFILGAYNYLRFGSWFEFGVKYQLAGINMHALNNFLNVANLPDGFYFYFLQTYSWKFPLFSLNSTIPPFLNPVPQYSLEPVTGIFIFLPLLGLIVILPFIYRRIWVFNKEVLIILLSILSCGIIIAAFDSCALGATMRYELDFLPSFVLATFILIFFLSEITWKNHSKLHTMLLIFIILSVVWGSIFNLEIGLTGYYYNLRVQNPTLYYSISDLYHLIF